MVRRVGLDDGSAAARAAAGPASNLGQELKGALAGAEVGQVEPNVGQDDADEGDAREVERLGDQLGANQDVGLVVAELGPDVGVAAATAAHVAIPAQQARPGQDGPELLLDPLSADP